MDHNEISAAWNFSKMVAINIGSVTLSKEFILAIDDFINRQKAEIERLQTAMEEAVECFHRMESLYHIKCVELKVARAEAVKEFAEGLKFLVGQFFQYEDNYRDPKSACERAINMMLKKFTEGIGT